MNPWWLIDKYRESQKVSRVFNNIFLHQNALKLLLISPINFSKVDSYKVLEMN